MQEWVDAVRAALGVDVALRHRRDPRRRARCRAQRGRPGCPSDRLLARRRSGRGCRSGPTVPDGRRTGPRLGPRESSDEVDAAGGQHSMTLVEPRWDDARAALAAAVRPLAPVPYVWPRAMGWCWQRTWWRCATCPRSTPPRWMGGRSAGLGRGPSSAVPGRAPGPGSADHGAGGRDRDRGGGPCGGGCRGPQRGRPARGAGRCRGAARRDAPRVHPCPPGGGGVRRG